MPIFLLSLFLCFGVITASETPALPAIDQIQLDIHWVAQLVKTYPELCWLANENVKKTEEGISTTSPDNWSEPLFGKKYDEFERSVVSLICYQSILNGQYEDYARLTQTQPSPLKLSRQAFLNLHAEAENLLKTHFNLTPQEMHQAIQTALVLGDMGKTAAAREKARFFGVEDPDHDDFIAHALRTCPQIFPSFMALPRSAQEMIVRATGLIHFGHVAHLEGGPEIFSKLKGSQILNQDPFIFNFAFFVHTCDVAGALGHRDYQHSLMLEEKVYKTLCATEQACQLLKNQDETAAYRYFLKQRADWLGLNIDHPIDRVLAKIGAMLRLYDPEDGKILVAALDSFTQGALDLFIDEFDVSEVNATIATPTYVPAMLINLMNNPALGETRESRIKKAIDVGLPFLVRVLDWHRQQVLKGNCSGSIPINFNPIAGIAKEKEAVNLIQQSKFLIDKEGNVHLQY